MFYRSVIAAAVVVALIAGAYFVGRLIGYRDCRDEATRARDQMQSGIDGAALSAADRAAQIDAVEGALNESAAEFDTWGGGSACGVSVERLRDVQRRWPEG